MIICNKLDNYFVVSADRQTIWGFEMTANLRDTSPLINKLLLNILKNSSETAITCPLYASLVSIKHAFWVSDFVPRRPIYTNLYDP